jgi:Hint domain/Pretoxin HINT domain
MKLDANGKLQNTGCFTAGTLVHTAEGLVPIQAIRLGTQVLSQPEDGGERALRRVIIKVSHWNQKVMAVQVRLEGDRDEASESTTIFATPNHPFWVNTRVVNNQHWLAAECLVPGMVLQLADGRSATVHTAAFILCTQHEGIFFAGDERVGQGQVLCLRDGQLTVADDAQLNSLGPLNLAEPFLTPVYNFEVEGFHTYYVGEIGVWVHNTNCPKQGWVDLVFEKAQIESTCFSGDTLIMVKPWTSYFHGLTNVVRMGHIEVGSFVLSRCERTGEIAYKEVTKVFDHGWRTSSYISFRYDPKFHAKPGDDFSRGITTTADHPFWVQGKGWTKVRDLQPDDEMLTHDGTKLTVGAVHLDKRLTVN